MSPSPTTGTVAPPATATVGAPASRTTLREHPGGSLAPLFAGMDDGAGISGAQAHARTKAALLGTTAMVPRLSRYVPQRRLGAGAMGEVWLADDPALARQVAIKLVRAGAGRGIGALAERMAREARALAKLSHPNVVQVFDVGTYVPGADAGTRALFIVMEFVDGPPLGQWLAASSRSWQSIVARFLEAGTGLAAAHDAGLVHRDFKPANVLVGADGRARVGDFGLARLGAVTDSAPDPAAVHPVVAHELVDTLGEGLTETGLVLGTPLYMAPEQHAGGTVDARADQYAFCVALYEALAGVRPFRGDLEAIARAKRAGTLEPPRPGAVVPDRVLALLRRGLAARPEDRWPSMHVLLQRLHRATRRRRWRGTHVAVFASAVALVWSWRAPGSACPEAERLDDAWNARVQADVHRALAEDADVATADEIVAALDRRATALRDRLEHACVAQGADTACLRDATTALSTVTEVLARAPRSVSQGIRLAIDDLPDPAACVGAAPGAEVSAEITALRDDLARVRALSLVGVHSEAVAIGQPAVARAAAAGPAAAEVSAALAFELGVSLDDLGRADEAAGAYRDAYFGGLALDDHALAAMAAIRLAVLDAEVTRIDDGATWRRHADAALGRATLSPCDAVTYRQLHAFWDSMAGDLDRSVAALRALDSDCDQDRCPVSCTATKGNLSELLARLGDEAKSVALRREVIERFVEYYGADSIYVAEARIHLAAQLVHLARGEDGPELVETTEQLALGVAAIGERAHPARASAALVESQVARARGDRPAAVEAARRAVRLSQATYPPGDPSHAVFRGTLANALGDAGDLVGALMEYDALIDMLPVGTYELVPMYVGRSYTRMETGDLDGAIADARHARALVLATTPGKRDFVAKAYGNELLALRRARRCDEAVALAREGADWADRFGFTSTADGFRADAVAAAACADDPAR